MADKKESKKSRNQFSRLKATDLMNLGLIEPNWSIPNFQDIDLIKSRGIIVEALLYINTHRDDLEVAYMHRMRDPNPFSSPVSQIIVGFIDSQKRKVELVKLEEELEPLRRSMKKIDKLITDNLPDFPEQTNHSLEKFLLDTVDLAPKSVYRKSSANKVTQLMDIIDKIQVLKKLVMPPTPPTPEGENQKEVQKDD